MVPYLTARGDMSVCFAFRNDLNQIFFVSDSVKLDMA